MDEFEPQVAIYQIRVRGRLNQDWANWLNGMVISIEDLDCESSNTRITVRVPDQAALRGILNKIWDLNLTLISVITCDE